MTFFYATLYCLNIEFNNQIVESGSTLIQKREWDSIFNSWFRFVALQKRFDLWIISAIP